MADFIGHEHKEKKSSNALFNGLLATGWNDKKKKMIQIINGTNVHKILQREMNMGEIGDIISSSGKTKKGIFFLHI